MSTFLKDARHALRALLKSPGFTAVAVLTLALGIGANSAIFSLVNAVLVRPLPFSDPDSLVMLYHSHPEIGLHRASVSPIFLADYKETARAFTGLGAFTSWRGPQNLTGGGEPVRVPTVLVSGDFFSVLGARPLLGRVLLPEDDVPGRDRVVVLGHAIWRERFGGDQGILGRPIVLDGEPYTVVGVMPGGFEYPAGGGLWVPIAFRPEQAGSYVEYLGVVARLKPGTAFLQAQAEMDSVAAGVRARHPEAFSQGDAWAITLVPLRETIVGDVRPALLILMAAVGLVLLIACANVANLLLAKTAARHREIAIRTSLGATRGRLLLQFLTESLLLALIGGGLGLLLGIWGLDLLLAWLPLDVPGFIAIHMDASVLICTLLVSVLTGVAFGVLPALQATRPGASEAIKEGGRGQSGGRGRARARALLVVTEVALALVLLVGAGLLIRSFVRLRDANAGFNPQNLLTLRLFLPETKYREPHRMTAFYDEVLRRVAALPGVRAAAAVSTLPLNRDWSASFYLEGRTDLSPTPHADIGIASPGYLRALEVPLRKGRFFTEEDGPGALPVAVIDEIVARRFWPEEDPVGKRVALAIEGTEERPVWRQIVGVVGHVKHDPVNDNLEGEVLAPARQVPQRIMSLLVRGGAGEAALAPAVRAQILAVDRDQAVSDVRTMDQVLSVSVAQPRFNTLVLALFAALAVILAVVGIYGVVSYAVAQRTREVGIRIALGARQGDILRLVLGQGLRLALTGVALGLLGAFALTRLMTRLLFGISPTDPLTFAAVSLALAGVALLASYVPARRAARVDPIVALRWE